MTRRFVTLPSILIALLAALLAISGRPETATLAVAASPAEPGSGTVPEGLGDMAGQAFDCATVTEISQSECVALVALYEDTNGPGWALATSWLETTTPCDWYGVTCDASHVSQLNLEHNALSGSIPSAIGNLDALRVLAMSYNALSGPIPTELGNLVRLQSLYLDDTKLAGPLPAELGQLAALQTLAISRAQLKGEIPSELGNLSELRYLGLAGNQLEGALPSELSSLRKLDELRLDHNGFSDTIPPEWGDLESVRTLDLSGNELTGMIPAELGKLASMRNLYLNDNHLSGTIPPELGRLQALQRYNPSSDAASDTPTPDAENHAEEDAVPLDGAVSPPVDGYLDLSCNQLSGSIPPELGALHRLYELRLNANRLSGSIPSELRALQRSNAVLVDYNMLHDTEKGVISLDSDWRDTQTVPPGALTASSTGISVILTWTPILYTGDGGYYEVSYAPDSGEGFSVAGHTANKAEATFTVTGLIPGQRYLFRVRTHTPAHSFYAPGELFGEHYQQNDLWSEYSAPVYATAYDPTTDMDCGPPPTPSAPYTGVPPTSSTIYRRVAHCLDDAYVTLGSTTHMDNSGNYIRMGGREGSQVPYVSYVDGILFRDLRIPQGAHIRSASVRQFIWWQSGIPVKAAIAGQLSPQAKDFRLANAWAQERAQTAVTVTWTLNTLNQIVSYSPDVSAIIQEIVDQENWRPGNNLALLISPLPDGNQYVDWWTYDFIQSSGAQLAVSYGDPETPTPTPSPTPTVTPSPTPTSTPTEAPTGTPEPPVIRMWLPQIIR